MSKKIIFTKVNQYVSDIYYPKPASSCLPEWYKNTPSYTQEKSDINDKRQNSTIKKCVPVLDAFMSGYIITTFSDILVKKDENGNTVFLVSGNGPGVEFHPITQAPYHPSMNFQPYPKIINPWSIRTQSGHSCMFINPVHSGNKYLSILEGVVDTDKFFSNINFPFVLKDKNFEGIIPAGTPIVQIIPFKRDSWVSKRGSQKDVLLAKENFNTLLTMFFGRYKTMFWQKKSYK